MGATQQNRQNKEAATASKLTATSKPTDKPKKPRLSELPGAIPIGETARIAAVLNHDAFWDVMARIIFEQNTATTQAGQLATLPKTA